MIYNFYSASLIFLAGFCLLSAVNHFTARQPDQKRRVHLLFAVIAFLLALGCLSSVAALNAPALADHIAWERINISFNILLFALLPWFFALYSGVHAKPVLVGGSVLCVLLFFINLIQPSTLLYSEIHGIERLILPWGEEIFLFKATSGIWGIIATAYVLLVPVFGFYVIIRRFRHDHSRTTLSMIFAVALYWAASIQAVFVRVLGVHDLPPMGSYGYISMVLVMGLTLTHELRADRRKAEESLRQSERKTRAILDQGFVFIGLMSLDGILLDANRSSLKLVGMPLQDVLNKPFWESPWWNHSIELQKKLRESIKSAASGVEVRFEASHPGIDGSLRYVDFSLRPVKNDQGDIEYLIPEGHDITERKLVEEELRKSEARLNAIISSMQDIIFEIDGNGCFEGYHASNSKKLYAEPDNFLGKQLEEVLPGYVCTPMRQAIEAINYGSTYQQYEYHLTINNKIEWEHAVISPRYNSSNEYVGVTAVCRNITERKRAEEELQKSQELYHDLVEASQDLIWQCDDQGRYVYLNPACESLYGYRIDEMIGKSFTEFQSPRQAQQDMEVFGSLLKADGIVKGYETVHLKKDGTEMHLVFNAKVLFDSDGNVSGTRGTAYDITERKRAAEELEHTKKSYEAIFNSSTDCIFIHDSKTGEIVEVNQATIETFGYSNEDIKKLNVGDFSLNEPPYTQKEAVSFIHKAVTEGPQFFDWRVKKQSGELLWFENILKYVELAGVNRVLAVCRNITERKMIEESLRKSEGKYKTITETSPIGIWEITQDRRTRYINPAAISLLELDSEEELMEREIDSFFTPESLEVMKYEHSKREQGFQSSYEVEVVGSRGGRRNVVVSGAPLYSGEGKLTSLIGWFTDITERKQMEQRLKIERNNFEVAFESNPIAVLILDESNRIIRANAAAIDLSGGDESQVMHHRPGDAFHCTHSFEAGCGDGTACPLCPVRLGIYNLITGSGGPIDKAEIQLSVIREEKEQTLWLEVSAAEMLLDTQRAFIVLLDDITERKKSEAEIKLQNSTLEALNDKLAITNRDLVDSESRLNKSLNEKEILIREVYHRTKNTMQVIRGMIVLQSLDFPSNTELQQLVQNTEDRIQAISLVHQMLYQSQDLSQISIKEYVQNLIALLIQSYGFSSDRIAFTITVDDHKFLLDTAIPLGLIINELTTNSLKYAFPDGRSGTININLAQVESRNFLMIFSDDGVGVPDGFDFRNCESLGLKLIYSIGEDQMLGKINIENSNGIRCSLEFPGNLYKARI